MGHSHVGAIRHAAVRRRAAGGLPHLVRTINVTDPKLGDPTGLLIAKGVIPVELLTEVRRIVAMRRPMICTAIGGNNHTMISLVRSDQPWDFELSGEVSPPLDPRARIIPEAEAHAMLATTMAGQLDAMASLRAQIGPFWQIESPPPVRSSAFIAARIESYFLSLPAYARNGISPIGLRYRMWRLSCRIFADHCRALGCGYVTLPRAVFDRENCLDQGLAGDATHGNIEFGQHVIERLDKLARLPRWGRDLRRALEGVVTQGSRWPLPGFAGWNGARAEGSAERH